MCLQEYGRPLVLEVVVELLGVVLDLPLEPVEVYIHVPVLLDSHMFVQLLLSLFYYFIYLLHRRPLRHRTKELILQFLLGLQCLLVLGVPQVLLLLVQHSELLLLHPFVLGYFECLTFGVVISHVEGVQFVDRLAIFDSHTLLLLLRESGHSGFLDRVKVRGGNFVSLLLDG